MCCTVATDRDDETIPCRFRAIRGVAASAGLEDLDIDPQTTAGNGASFPEAAGSPTTGRRVDDYERAGFARIRLAFSTSRFICSCNAGTEAKRFSARRRWTNHTVSTSP
jgi:hypothetical protein